MWAVSKEGSVLLLISHESKEQRPGISAKAGCHCCEVGACLWNLLRRSLNAPQATWGPSPLQHAKGSQSKSFCCTVRTMGAHAFKLQGVIVLSAPVRVEHRQGSVLCVTLSATGNGTYWGRRYACVSFCSKRVQRLFKSLEKTCSAAALQGLNPQGTASSKREDGLKAKGKKAAKCKSIPLLSSSFLLPLAIVSYNPPKLWCGHCNWDCNWGRGNVSPIVNCSTRILSGSKKRSLQPQA